MRKNTHQKHIAISAREQKMVNECKETIQKLVDAHDLPYTCRITDTEVLRQGISCLWKMLKKGEVYEALWQMIEELEE